MSRFTEYVRKYSAATLTPDEFTRCLRELGAAVRSRLRRLSMWEQPPAYFGYPDYQSWDEAFARGEEMTDVALDCFDFAIHRSLDNLAERLETAVTDNIDGLVYLNINNFLFQRQRQNDPVGHAVFENLRAALWSLHNSGAVGIDSPTGDGIRNPSAVYFRQSGGAEPDRAVPLASEHDLEEALAALAGLDPLLAPLSECSVTAQARLAECLGRLGATDIRACTFRDLVNILKQRVRTAHQARHRPSDAEAVVVGRRGDQEIVELIRIIQPDRSYHDNEGYAHLLHQIREEIATLPQERTRRGVARLFEEILQHRAVDEELPPLDELARRLGINRSTLHDHLSRLRDICSKLTTRKEATT
jgi:hypothetical protein